MRNKNSQMVNKTTDKEKWEVQNKLKFKNSKDN